MCTIALHDLDKRIDESIELRIAESYVSKSEFVRGSRQHGISHMIRIEEKLDKLVDKNTCNM